MGGEWPTNGVEEVRTVAPALQGPGAWSVIDGAELRPAVIEKPGVRVTPTGGPVLVRVPLHGEDFATPVRDVDLIRLRVIVPRFARIAAIAGRGTEWETFTAITELAIKRSVTQIELPFTSSGASGHDLTEITLFMQGAEAPLEVLGVDVVKLPTEARLPEPTNGSAPYVAIGSESRPAHGVIPGLELVSQLPPLTNGRIEFGAALPPALAPAKGATVKATIFRGGEVIGEESFSLSAGRWTECSLPATLIDGREGAELHIASEIESGLICSTPIAIGPAKAEPKTVLLVTSDTHRADYVGFAPGDPRVKTPVMDELSASGLTFHQARSVSSITNPSHTSILTGLSPRDSGVQGNLTLLSDRATTIAESFREAGYRTFAAASARHLSPGRSGLGQGFERFDAPTFLLARDGKVALGAAKSMLEEAEGQDVFLWLHFFDVHGPYRDHPEFTKLYYDRSKDDPFSKKYAELPPEKRLPWEHRVRDAKFALALYSGEVTYVDTMLGSLFQVAPRLRDGWIALTADHGEAHGEQGLWWTHNGVYPSTLDVPLLITGPGVPKGVHTGPVSNTSVSRTLLALAEIDGAEEFPGRRLDQLPTDADGSTIQLAKGEPHFVIGPDGNSAGLFADGWYFLLHVTGKGWGNPRRPARHAAELYDLREDPGCVDNVIRQNLLKGAEMRHRVVAYLNDLPEDGTFASDAVIGGSAKADMVALGYAADTSGKREGALVDPACVCVFCKQAKDILAQEHSKSTAHAE